MSALTEIEQQSTRLSAPERAELAAVPKSVLNRSIANLAEHQTEITASLPRLSDTLVRQLSHRGRRKAV